MLPGRKEPGFSARHRLESAQADRRWLVVWTALFVGWLALSGIAMVVYRATGPHPEMTLFLRALRHEARWFIPGLKHKPNAKDGAVRLESGAPRFAAVERPRG